MKWIPIITQNSWKSKNKMEKKTWKSVYELEHYMFILILNENECWRCFSSIFNFFLIILNTINNHFKALNEILFCFLIFYFFGHLKLWTSIYVYSMPCRLLNCVLCLKRIKQTQNVRNNNENKSFFLWYMNLWTEHIYDLIVLLFVAYCVNWINKSEKKHLKSIWVLWNETSENRNGI